jgi:hypothetical protein
MAAASTAWPFMPEPRDHAAFLAANRCCMPGLENMPRYLTVYGRVDVVDDALAATRQTDRRRRAEHAAHRTRRILSPPMLKDATPPLVLS